MNAPRSASASTHLDPLGVAEDEAARVQQGLERAPDLLALVEAGERAHPHAPGRPGSRP